MLTVLPTNTLINNYGLLPNLTDSLNEAGN